MSYETMNLFSVVLGQFVVESLVYNIRYEHLAQDCQVYSDFTTSKNVSLSNTTYHLLPNGTAIQQAPIIYNIYNHSNR